MGTRLTASAPSLDPRPNPRGLGSCHGNFGPAKKIGPGDQNSRKNGPPDYFSSKNLVRTWNNGPSTSTMFDRDCCLRKVYGSMLKVVSSIREPRYVTRKEKQSPDVAGFP